MPWLGSFSTVPASNTPIFVVHIFGDPDVIDPA